jgi:hypothetical protein
MSPEILQLIAQFGIAGLMFYLLLDERKARQALETKISTWLDEELELGRGHKPDVAA